MPSVSKSQQHLFGMVEAYKKGKLANPPAKIKEVAGNVSATSAHHFAATKTTGLPTHVKQAEEFVVGFVKRAESYGLTVGQAVALAKEAGMFASIPYALAGAGLGALAGGVAGTGFGVHQVVKPKKTNWGTALAYGTAPLTVPGSAIGGAGLGALAGGTLGGAYGLLS